MNAKPKNIKSNLKKVRAHKIKDSEYEELPELTDKMLNRAIYKLSGVEKTPPRGRGKQKAPTKIALNLRLPREVVDYFRSEGRGWQVRLGNALKDWIKTHPH